jgi:hypothetical protein
MQHYKGKLRFESSINCSGKLSHEQSIPVLKEEKVIFNI